MYKDTVIVLYSGGMGSFLTAYLLKQKQLTNKMTLYFNDTLGESNGLYNFLLDTVNYFFPSSNYGYLKGVAANIPELTTGNEKKRKKYLLSFGNLLERNYSDVFKYDADGRFVWEVFEDVKFVGNTRIDPCSRILKRERSQQFVAGYDPSCTDVAIGIDWSERHRHTTAIPNWSPYSLIAPLIDFNIDKEEYKTEVLSITGIRESDSYGTGLAHDNCGGFCVKAGLGHFKILLETRPDVYMYNEEKQESLARKTGESHPFLRKTIKGKLYYITLREYRQYLESGTLFCKDTILLNNGEFDPNKEFDELDIAGCGCAI